MHAEGPTRVLSVEDMAVHPWDCSPAEPQPLAAASAAAAARPAFLARGGSLSARVELAGLGVSLVSGGEELLYLSLAGLRLEVAQDTAEAVIHSTVARIQVDNQTRQPTAFPVLLQAGDGEDSGAGASGGAARGGGGPGGRIGAAASAAKAAAKDAATSAKAAAKDAASSAMRRISIIDRDSLLPPPQPQLQPQPQTGVERSDSGSRPPAPSSASASASASVARQPPPPQAPTAPVLAAPRGAHRPAVSLRFARWRRRTGGVICVREAQLEVAPLILELDDELLEQLPAVLDALLRPHREAAAASLQHPASAGSAVHLESFAPSEQAAQLAAMQAAVPAAQPAEAASAQLQAAAPGGGGASGPERLYIERLRVSPVALRITFARLPFLPPGLKGLAGLNPTHPSPPHHPHSTPTTHPGHGICLGLTFHVSNCRAHGGPRAMPCLSQLVGACASNPAASPACDHAPIPVA